MFIVRPEHMVLTRCETLRAMSEPPEDDRPFETPWAGIKTDLNNLVMTAVAESSANDPSIVGEVLLQLTEDARTTMDFMESLSWRYDDYRSFQQIHQALHGPRERLSFATNAIQRVIAARDIYRALKQTLINVEYSRLPDGGQGRQNAIVQTVLEPSIVALEDIALELQNQRLSAATDRIEQIAAQTEQIARRDERIAENRAQVANAESVVLLNKNFDTYASDELAEAKRCQTTYIALLSVGTILAVIIGVFWLDNDFLSAETAKLAIALPLYVLATNYALRATKHRESAHRAQEISVRLRTLGAYTEGTDEESRKTILASFGKELFSVAHLSGPRTSKEKDLTGLLALVEQIQKIANSSAPAKKE
jgi:hypothetical protein